MKTEKTENRELTDETLLAGHEQFMEDATTYARALAAKLAQNEPEVAKAVNELLAKGAKLQLFVDYTEGSTVLMVVTAEGMFPIANLGPAGTLEVASDVRH